MAYNALNNLIDAYIYANGVQAITGQILNGVLKQMVSQLGSGYHLMGVAGPETIPEQNDYAMAYFAATAGEYTGFGGITLAAGEVAVLLTYGNGSWAKQTLYIVPTGTADLENTANFITNAVNDLVNYYTKAEFDTQKAVTDAALAARYTKTETDTKLAGYYRKAETYDKDEVDSIVAALSRQEYIVAWDGLAEPDIDAIPAGVTVTYNATPYTGTLTASASTLNKIYMVWNGTAYDMYGTSRDGGFSWVPMGTTTVALSDYVTISELGLFGDEVEAKFQEVGQMYGLYVDDRYNVSTSPSTREFNIVIKEGNEIKASLSDPNGHVGGSIKFYVWYDGENDYRSGEDITTEYPYSLVAEKDIIKVRFYKYSPSSAGEIGVRVELVQSKQDKIVDVLAKSTSVAINQIENGKYIDNTGTLQTDSAYGVYLVDVPAYTALYCSARAASTVCVFAHYDEGSYTPILISNNGVNVGYYYVNPTNSMQSIAVCSVKSEYAIQYLLDGLSTESLPIIDGLVSPLYTNTKVIPTEERTYGDGYIQKNGIIEPASSCRTTNAIVIPPYSWIKATARGFTNINAVIASPVDISQGIYTPLVIATSNIAQEYYYFNNSDVSKDVVINYVKETLSSVSILSSGVISEVSKAAYENKSENPCEYIGTDKCRIFKNILCIGDSLTEGRFDFHTGGVISEVTLPDYSYPTYLKNKTGRDTTNKGDAGQTTKTWWNLHQNDDLSGHDACIIALGRNDYVPGRETTSEERHTYMANIIDKVRSENNRIKIFVSTMLNYYTGDSADEVNEDMREIASENSCYLIDISRYGNLISGTDNYSHLTAMGYEKLAGYYFNYISYIIAHNESAFRDVQFVGTNYQW